MEKKTNNNAMKKIGQGIKETFIEMSESLAGWIDDASTQFSGKSKKTNSTAAKNSSVSKTKASTCKSHQCQNYNKPVPEN